MPSARRDTGMASRDAGLTKISEAGLCALAIDRNYAGVFRDGNMVTGELFPVNASLGSRATPSSNIAIALFNRPSFIDKRPAFNGQVMSVLGCGRYSKAARSRAANSIRSSAA
jgi:hypothetical protein